MHKTWIFMLNLFVLAGCKTPVEWNQSSNLSSSYGNFSDAPVEFSQKMAEDSVTQLLALYLPAQTRFRLMQETKDMFGETIVASLRLKGYGLVEFFPDEKFWNADTSKNVSVSVNQPSELPSTDLRYVVDRLRLSEAKHFYRVTVAIGKQSISRVYTVQGDTVLPAGSWIRKE